MEHKITPQELAYRQSLPLQDKIDMSCERIEQWYDQWKGNVYISFSGGKDSTVLLDIVRNKALIPDSKLVPAVFADTGLEYPEIRNFVKTIDNVVWLKPKHNFIDVLEKYGYPIISKEQATFIRQYRTAKSEKTKNTRMYGDKNGGFKISEKWKFLIDAPFKISEECCNIMKKHPMKKYGKKSGRKGIIGTLAYESRRRTINYLLYGCNSLSATNPLSHPLSFWVENDIWEYIHKYNLPYSKIYDMGYDRTGCMFCMFGVQAEECPNRFQKMAKTHPKLYKYCIEDLGLDKVMDYINVDYKPQ
jgi:3'-phosphoadenosine 5'-phosphosulfate sulfotransferase (PAPS reductase)/FAD synthetase